ncbi:hypothetical protein V8C37DRAFT_366604 [Trichoderma ceciliae]
MAQKRWHAGDGWMAGERRQRGLFWEEAKRAKAIGHLSQTTARPVKEKMDPVCGQGCKVAPLYALDATRPSQLDEAEGRRDVAYKAVLCLYACMPVYSMACDIMPWSVEDWRACRCSEAQQKPSFNIWEKKRQVTPQPIASLGGAEETRREEKRQEEDDGRGQGRG